MADVIDTAGLGPSKPAAGSSRREVIKAARAVMRQADATDDEFDDALEALIELSKE